MAARARGAPLVRRPAAWPLLAVAHCLALALALALAPSAGASSPLLAALPSPGGGGADWQCDLGTSPLGECWRGEDARGSGGTPVWSQPAQAIASAAGCPWCESLPDGLYADHLALRPCSGFFQCQGGSLRALYVCPAAQAFSQDLRKCVPEPQSGCQDGMRMRGVLTLHAAAGEGRMDYSAMNSSEVRALMAFKRANVDPTGVMASWVPPRTTTRNATAAAHAPKAGAAKGKVGVHRQGSTAASLSFLSTWAGVTWDPRTNSVTALALNNSGGTQCLWGEPSVGQSLPPELGNLRHLAVLDLGGNGQCAPQRGGVTNPSPLGGLTGSIPGELSRCTALSVLRLQQNRLRGSVPAALSALSRLQELDLSYNALSGPFPLAGSLRGLQNLTSLNLQSNDFEGPLPPDISALTGLTALTLQSLPRFGGSLPSELGALTRLRVLTLYTMAVEGSIPEALSKLVALTSLTLNSLPKLDGAVPAWFPNIPDLSYLCINGTAVNGSLPPSLGTALSTLTLGQNRLSSNISAALVKELKPTIARLDLSGNQLTGPFPTGLAGSKALGYVKLSGNALEGPFPNISFFTSLVSTLYQFEVADNRLDGPVPSALLRLMPLMASLDISGNRLSGPAPPVVCNSSSSSLSKVWMHNNAFDGDVGTVLGPETRTCAKNNALQLDLSFNRLSGTLPRRLLSLNNLQSLNLENNNISGPVPAPSAARCSSLVTLKLANNALTGAIPSALLRSCTSLQFLDLSGNALDGGIPVADPQGMQGPEGSAAGSGGGGNATASATYPPLNALLLGGNQLTGSLPAELTSLKDLTLLDVSNNHLEGPLPPEMAQFPRLLSLDASGNGLSGGLPTQLALSPYLASLSLADNHLSGPIPPELAPPNLRALTLLDLAGNAFSGNIFAFANASLYGLAINFSSNNLSGRVPADSSGAVLISPDQVANNSGLCGGAGYDPCPPEPQASSGLSTGAIVGIAVGAAVGLLAIGLGAFLFLRGRDAWSGGTMLVFKEFETPLTARYLFDVTGGFSEDYQLGRGGFGAVYKAELEDGTVVAIKRLAVQSSQGDEEFKAEVQTLGSLSHRNLVKLIAAYVAAPPSPERLLVYEYLPGGSLDKILVENMSADSPYRKWELRLRICLDVARGLKYLHHDCHPPLIHRDMKPANVLMDEELVAHLADFGLAKEADMTKTHMSNDQVFGTVGFLAPEYSQLGRLSLKSDVFAYGVTMLQLVTGRSPTDADVAERGLSRWIGTSAAAAVVDPQMEVGDKMDQVLGAIKLGLLCISRIPCDRPTMREVVHVLDNLEDFASGIKA